MVLESPFWCFDMNRWKGARLDTVFASGLLIIFITMFIIYHLARPLSARAPTGKSATCGRNDDELANGYGQISRNFSEFKLVNHIEFF